MSDDIKLRSVKWSKLSPVLTGLTAQFPENSQFQIYSFNNEVQPVIDNTEGEWIDASDKEKLDQAIRI